jgi:hypothetical protein
MQCLSWKPPGSDHLEQETVFGISNSAPKPASFSLLTLAATALLFRRRAHRPKLNLDPTKKK